MSSKAEVAAKILGAQPANIPAGAPIKYGTAGFRANAQGMERVMYRVGAVAALRARFVGKPTGVVITASHNPAPDNGSKVVDGDGGMMDPSWEGFATSLANATTQQELEQALSMIWPEGTEVPAGGGKVVIGRDTRSHSPLLAGLVAIGIEALGHEVLDLGLVTTPQVHWVVKRMNEGSPCSLSDYYSTHVEALSTLLNGKSLPPVTVDCACGVGSLAVEGLSAELKKQGVSMDLKVINAHDSQSGQLNEKCGAEHVQKSKSFPLSMDPAAAAASSDWFCSFDGDADRIVFLYSDENQQLELLDGDKILSLLCQFIATLLEESGLDLSLGAVQTAYANGASTIWIQQEVFNKTKGVGKREVALVATGVKHLHHKALDYHIGAYFEANGHGTVIFNDEARAAIKAAAEGPDAKTSAKLLNALANLINPAIGDALSDMLAVVGVLVVKGWGQKEWAKIYKDRPSCMTKVLVKDRSLIKTTADETRVLEPSELQLKIDQQVSQVGESRSFVRPSGTEDCVRVYAEAPSLAEAQALAAKVGEEVTKLLG